MVTARDARPDRRCRCRPVQRLGGLREKPPARARQLCADIPDIAVRHRTRYAHHGGSCATVEIMNPCRSATTILNFPRSTAW